MNDWIKIDTSSNESTNHDFKVNPELSGVYVSMKDNLGSNGSKLYSVRTSNGVVDFWGSAVIDNKMARVPLGNEVLVKFLGEKKNEKTKRTYKDFDVYHKPASKSPVSFDNDWSN